MTSFDTTLLIDDEDVSILICSRIIEHAQFSKKTINFTSAKEALLHLQSSDTTNIKFPDVIFLDINMPVMNGWEFLDSLREQIKKRKVKCLIFILSSSNNSKDKEKAKTYVEVTGFIEKPLTIEKLKEISRLYIRRN